MHRASRTTCDPIETPETMKLADTARLLAVLRINAPAGQVGLLSVEVLLHVAEGPKTLAELQRLTGATNGPISRAVRMWCPWKRRFTDEVVEARLPLLKRIHRPGKPPVVHLSVTGWRTLHECGLL